MPRNLGFAYTLLRQICRPDNEYPEGLVSSLYFDTADLDQYIRSASGDLKKDKVRIRWYDELDDYQETVPVFIELKKRQGFASSKQRQRIMVPLENGFGRKSSLNAIFGLTNDEAVMLDFDETPFRQARDWALKTMKFWDMKGLIILKSSEDCYHVVFDRPVSWDENVQIMSWVCLLTKHQKFTGWFILVYSRSWKYKKGVELSRLPSFPPLLAATLTRTLL